jgi:hypothetical protein
LQNKITSEPADINRTVHDILSSIAEACKNVSPSVTI